MSKRHAAVSLTLRRCGTCCCSPGQRALSHPICTTSSPARDKGWGWPRRRTFAAGGAAAGAAGGVTGACAASGCTGCSADAAGEAAPLKTFHNSIKRQMINRCVPAQHWLSVRLQHAQTRMAPWLCHVRTHHASTLVSSGACMRRFAWQADSLLDFACGRGGDLQKWFDAGVRSAPQPLQQSTSVPRRLPALRPRPTRRRLST